MCIYVVIRQLLLRFNISFVTTSLDTVDTSLLLRLCTLVEYQTTAKLVHD